MPDIIHNKVILNTDDQTASNIRKRLEHDDELFDLDRIVKEPDDIKHKDESLLSDLQLFWRDLTWGTKWQPMDVDWKNDKEICFDTAWKPPIPALQELSKELPAQDSIIVLYTDEFIDDIGCTVLKKGKAKELAESPHRVVNEIDRIFAAEIANTTPEQIKKHQDQTETLTDFLYELQEVGFNINRE